MWDWLWDANEGNDEMEKVEFIQLIESERAKFDIAVEKLQQYNDLLSPVNDKWLVKDMIAHIVCWLSIDWSNGQKPIWISYYFENQVNWTLRKENQSISDQCLMFEKKYKIIANEIAYLHIILSTAE